MFGSGGRGSDDSGFTAAGENAGLRPRASLERDTCNVSADANPGPDNDLLEELERHDLCV